VTPEILPRVIAYWRSVSLDLGDAVAKAVNGG
jgi:hypothetical protein